MTKRLLIAAVLVQTVVGCSRGEGHRPAAGDVDLTSQGATNPSALAESETVSAPDAAPPTEPASNEPSRTAAEPASHDESSGGCEDVGGLLVWRYSPTLSVLPDGKVLIAGGRHHDAFDYLREAEIFDPKTRTFTPTADLHEGRAMHQAFTLPNGNVVVIGGVAKALEIYDVQSGRWQKAGQLRVPVASFFAAMMDDGSIYIGGGSTMSEDPYSTLAYLWNPKTRRLKSMPSLRPEGFAGSVFGRKGRQLVVLSYPKYFGETALRLLDTASGTQTDMSYTGQDPLLRELSGNTNYHIEQIVSGPDGQPLDPTTIMLEDGIERVEGGKLRKVARFNRPHRAGAAVALASGEIMVAGDIEEEHNMVELCRLPPIASHEPQSDGTDEVDSSEAATNAPPTPPLAPEDVGFVDRRKGHGWGDRCFLHLKAGRHGPAKAACLRGLEIAEDDGVRGAIYYNLGRIAEDTGDSTEALQHYRRSLELRPGNDVVEERIRALEGQ